MSRSLFYYVVFGFIGGVVVHSVIAVPLSYCLLALLISVALLISLFKSEKIAILCCVALVSASCGLVRYELFISWKGDEVLYTQVDQKIVAEGIIVEEPSAKEKYTKLIVSIDRVNRSKIIPTKIIAQDGLYSERAYGDRIQVEGKLSLPKNIEKENERSFDYVAYLQKDKIFFEMKYAKVMLLTSHQGNKIMQGVFALKNKALHALEQTIPFPESTLGTGIVVAGKGALPKEILDEFQRTGTIQVVVLSGLNVTLVAEVIILLCSSLPLVLSVMLSSVMVMLFAIAAGGSATIFRAVAMVLVALGAKLMRRKYDAARALIISGVVMLLFNPMLLVYDPSFQLSFLATVGLIYATPLVAAKVTCVTERFGLRELVASGTATQIFITPFLIFLTGDVSLVSVPANMVVGVLVPIAMLASFLTAIAGIFSLHVAVPFGIVAYIVLKTMLTIVHVFSIIPFASLTLGSLPFWVVALCYGCFVIILKRTRKIVQQFPN
jgi:competence protein ComEC